MNHLTALSQEVSRQGELPQDFEDATIVHLYRRKGNRQLCDNHRGISLQNITGKIFARILLNRPNHHFEQGLLLESQCGLRLHRGTTDMIFAARQLQEKGREIRTHLYSTFVDLTKAFDTMNREGLWKIMQKFGCSERYAQMVGQLHDGMVSLMFSAMLMDAYRDELPRIRIAYRTDDQILNRRRLHFQYRASTTTVHCSPTTAPSMQLLIETCKGARISCAPVPDAPTCTHLIRLYCPHCPRTFTYRMALVGHKSVQESGIDRRLDTPSTSCTSTMPSSAHIPPPSTPNTISSTTLSTSYSPTMPNLTHTSSPSVSIINSPTTSTTSVTDKDTADFSCAYCSCTFTSTSVSATSVPTTAAHNPDTPTTPAMWIRSLSVLIAIAP
ncbi:hypothetical protein SprV_0401575200 [Sparganum proliferum]